MNIIITSAGKRVSLVRAFQRELQKQFPEGKVYTTDMYPELSAACAVSDGYFRTPGVREKTYMSALLTICLENDIRMVVPTIDTELQQLASHKRLFCEHGVNVVICSEEFVAICADKRKTKKFFSDRLINTPEEVDKRNPIFPFFIKPFDGSLSADTCVIRSAEEIKREHLENERFLFMEYFSKEEHDEYTVDMYYDKTGCVKCIVPRKRMAVRAGEISIGMTRKNDIIALLKDKLNHIEGAWGCLTAQFFMHKTRNEVTAIEINARFGGGYPLSYRAGANYPGWLIRECAGESGMPYSDNWEDRMLMLRYDDEVIVHADTHQLS